jgi:chaperonin GroL
VLSIESGTGLETTVEVEEGMEIDRGYISSQFVTNVERLTVEMENCRVLITDHKIEKVAELIPILEQITKANVPLLIIAEDVTAEALATLVVNKLRQVLSVVAIKAPGFGERRKSLLQDIAIVTGAEFIAKDLGMSVDSATLDQLGYIRKLTVKKDECTLIADAASAEDVRARVASLKKELSDSTSVYDMEKISERIAKLSGGVAVIKVGAATETELEDRKLRIEDAKNATFAAVEEGVVPGGGAALVHLAAMITEFKMTLFDEERLGAEIVQKAITAPARLIAANAGVEGEVVVQRVAKSDWAFGYNAMTDTYEDLLEAGVLDPKKVTRSGLQNACSVAGMVLTTQAVISEKPAKKVPISSGANGAMAPGMMSL